MTLHIKRLQEKDQSRRRKAFNCFQHASTVKILGKYEQKKIPFNQEKATPEAFSKLMFNDGMFRNILLSSGKVKDDSITISIERYVGDLRLLNQLGKLSRQRS